MPPQTPNTPPTTPGEDVLLDTLRRSKISDDQRQKLWDVYHTPGDEKAFVGAVNKLQLDDGTKQTLYDMRFKGFQNLGNTSPSASPTKVPEQVKGDLRPTNATKPQGPNQGGMLNWAMSEGSKAWQGIRDYTIDPLIAPYKQGVRDPITYATMLGQGIVDMHKDEFQKLKDAASAYAGDQSVDNAAHLIRHTMGQFPLLGPAAVGISETLASGEVSRGIGQTAGMVFGGKATEALHDLAKNTTQTILEHPRANEADTTSQQVAPVKPAQVEQTPVEAKPTNSTPIGSVEREPLPARLQATVHAPEEARAPMARSFVGQKNPIDMPSTVKYAKEGYTLGLPKQAFGEDEPASRSADPQAFIAPEPVKPAEAPQATQPSTRELKDQLGTMLGQQLGVEYRGLQEGMDPVPGHANPKVAAGIPDHLTFQDPQSGSSFMVPLNDATLEGARARLEAMRKPIAEKPPTPVAQTVAASAYRPKSFDLPDQLRANFDTMADLKRRQDIAESEAQNSTLQGQLDKVAAQSRAMLKEHIGSLNGDQLLQLRDKTKIEADQLDAQAKAISDLTEATIKNRGVKKEIADMRSTGGPVREMVTNPETGERAVVKPEAQVARGARSVLDEMQGRKPTSEFENLNVAAKPEGVSDQEWSEHVGRLQAERQDLKGKISEAVKAASEMGISLSASGGLDEPIARLKEIEGLLGKYVEEAKPGRRANIKAELDENGAIKAPETLKSWTLERVRLALGKKLKQMPSDEELFQHADMRSEKARYLRGVSDLAEKIRQARNAPKSGAERGAIGEQPLVGSAVPPTPIPNAETLVKRLKDAGEKGWKTTDEKPSGSDGWLSPDGKHWLDNGYLDHEDVANIVLHGNANAYGDLLNNGWIRKAGPTMYHTRSLGRSTLDAMEMDTIRGAVAGKAVSIDYESREPGVRIVSLDIPAGWDNLKDAVAETRRSMSWRNQRGAAPITHLAGGAAGMVAGTVAGAHLGGLPGAIAGGTVGFVAGFVTPAIAQSRSMRLAANMMAPIIRGIGGSLSSFFNGPRQLDVGSPDMKQILLEQQAHANRDTNWAERAKQLPAHIYKGFDPFAYVADQKNMGMIGRVLMSFDKDGKAFRDLQINDDTKSLYVALRNAGGKALGQRAYQGYQYSDIKAEALKDGIRPALDAYLNLKGYERVHQVLQEHVNDLNQTIQQIQQNLQNPNASAVQVAAMQDNLREVQSMKREIETKVRRGEATPKGYTPSKIQAEYATLQQQLGQQKYTQVEQIAQRTFQSRTRILDLLHSNGLIDLENYLTFLRRGPEYVPMERIMDDLENNKFSSGTQPLHLRHQTVIQELAGSERTNVNPWEAFNHADQKAFNQIYRNDAMRHAVDLAQTYPQSVGLDFKKVAPDYRPKAGEGILGHYDNGAPQLYAVPKYLSDTMQNLPLATKTAIGVMANWYAHKFKSAATVYNIGFQVSSFLYHGMSSAFLPESSLRPNTSAPVEAAKFVKGWLQAAKQVLDKDQNYREMVRSGAAFGTMQRMLDPEYFANPAADRIKNGKIVYHEPAGVFSKLARGRLLDAAQDVAATMEDVNKLNTWNRARAAGLNEDAAGWQTKQFGGAPDFSRLGDLSQLGNQSLMFFNANNQYLHQAMSAIRKDPMRVGGWMLAATAGMIALNAWNSEQKDSKGNDQLRKESVLDRQRNWVIVTPWEDPNSTGRKAVTFKVPKPKIFQLLNPIEDIVNYMGGKEDRTGVQQALDSISNVSPIHLKLKEGQVGKSLMQSLVSSAHPVAKTAVEQWSNTNDFGQPIVPASQQNIDRRYQIGPRTSPLAIRMGEGGLRGAEAGGALGATLGTTFGGWAGGIFGGVGGAAIGASGPSPRRTDAAINSMTASGGSMAEGYLNPFFTGTQSTKQMSSIEAVQNVPVVGQIAKRFTTNPMDASEQALNDRFYSTVQKLQEPLNTVKFLQKTHPDQVEGYLHEHSDDLWKGQMAGEMASRLNDLNQKQHQVENAQGLDEAKRLTVLKNIHDIKVQILRTFTSALERPAQQSTDTGSGHGGAR
jgi:Large polyvalent protein associated domain 38